MRIEGVRWYALWDPKTMEVLLESVPLLLRHRPHKSDTLLSVVLGLRMAPGESFEGILTTQL